MTELRYRTLVSFALTLLVGVAIVSMVVDRRAMRHGGRDLSRWGGALLDLAVPVEKAVAAPVDVVRGFVRRYVALLDVRSENERLRQELAALEEDNVQLREALLASERLERIAKMREEYEIPMLPAQLVGLDASPWFHSALVDRGRGHGLRSGMPVIAESGLVGLVTATSQGAARLMLLLDRQSAVDGVVQRSRARGIVRGSGGGDLEFEFAVRDGEVRPGDVVITSGLGGVYPKGLRIGEIREMGDPGPRRLQTAMVEPGVDFGRLEQVFVMLHRGPTMELLYAGEERDVGTAPPEPSGP